MDLASLQVFQTVVREHSFSRAAEKLYRTQPAVSISIRKLEEWVGQPLFVRGSGARMMTDAGMLLSEYADRMLNLREEISKGMKELRGLERGHVGGVIACNHALQTVDGRRSRRLAIEVAYGAQHQHALEVNLAGVR